MGVFDNLGKKIGDTAKNIKEESAEHAAVHKLNDQIEAKQADIGKQTMQIGTTFYGRYAADGKGDAELKAFCDAIVADLADIERLKADILVARKVWICPQCKIEVPFEAQFCSKCGAKQPPRPEPAAAEPAK